MDRDLQFTPAVIENGKVMALAASPGRLFGPSITITSSPNMASIPNLNSLRTTRRGPRLRGGRGGRAVPENDNGYDNEEAASQARDKTVQQTDNDASSSRLSAVSLGYLNDEFAKELSGQDAPPPKRYPIINRGTYVRTTAIDALVNSFLRSEPTQRKQIISLGAGSDTRFFRSHSQQSLASGDVSPMTYHELDFESNVQQKRSMVYSSPVFTSALRAAEKHGSTYHLHALDLRDLTAKSPPIIPHLDPTLATLILSECCLCYLAPELATSVLQYFNLNLATSPLAIILYEPIRPYDPFGRTMVTNLSSRGIHLQTLKRYSSLDAQRQRMQMAGFGDGQGARDVQQLYQSRQWVSAAERERVERLEWLDEVEEWHLLASHYCVAWGWRGVIFRSAWLGFDGGRTESERADDVT